jgi:hypothetical protein
MERDAGARAGGVNPRRIDARGDAPRDLAPDAV